MSEYLVNIDLIKNEGHSQLYAELTNLQLNNEDFEAAKFMSNNIEAADETIRCAIAQADGNSEEAALIAYGLEINDSNLNTLRAIKNIGNLNKSESLFEQPCMPKNAVAALLEAQETADSVKRGLDAGKVYPVKLENSKHGKGSLLVEDPEMGFTWLLKPGLGSLSPAAGINDEQVSPSRREAGFYHTSGVFGLEPHLPRTDLLLLDNKEYAVIKLLIPDYVAAQDFKKQDPNSLVNYFAPYLNSGILIKWATLDYILGNVDRHSGNILISSKTSDVKLIDHGSTMAGNGFNPADKSTFVPFYLRYHVAENFKNLSQAEKLLKMPKVPEIVADSLKAWFNSIDVNLMAGVLIRYGIEPKPMVERFNAIKVMLLEMPLDTIVATLWCPSL